MNAFLSRLYIVKDDALKYMAFRSACLVCLLSLHSLVFIFIIHQVILVLLGHKSMVLTCTTLLNMNHPFEKKMFRVEWFSVKTFYEKGWVLDISGIMWCHAFLSTFHFINPAVLSTRQLILDYRPGIEIGLQGLTK